jgi:hypothetical protein
MSLTNQPSYHLHNPLAISKTCPPPLLVAALTLSINHSKNETTCHGSLSNQTQNQPPHSPSRTTTTPLFSPSHSKNHPSLTNNPQTWYPVYPSPIQSLSCPKPIVLPYKPPNQSLPKTTSPSSPPTNLNHIATTKRPSIGFQSQPITLSNYRHKPAAFITFLSTRNPDSSKKNESNPPFDFTFTDLCFLVFC